MRLPSSHLAKKVEPERLKFWQTPSFDARPFLDYDNQQTFEFPQLHADRPDPERDTIPRVSVRCSGEAQMAFLELLDQTGRLSLVPPSEVNMDYRNGVFAIPKDESRERPHGVGRSASQLAGTFREEMDKEPWEHGAILSHLPATRGGGPVVCRRFERILPCFHNIQREAEEKRVEATGLSIVGGPPFMLP